MVIKILKASEQQFLFLQACKLHQTQNLERLIDEKLGANFNLMEAEKVVKIALLCTNASPSLRPTMSEVVNMLEGEAVIPDLIPEPSAYNEDLRFKALRDFHKHLSESKNQHSMTEQTFSSTSGGNYTYTSYIEDRGLVDNSN